MSCDLDFAEGSSVEARSPRTANTSWACPGSCWMRFKDGRHCQLAAFLLLSHQLNTFRRVSHRLFRECASGCTSDSASFLSYVQAMLTRSLLAICRSVATKEQVLVPETLLKKRKAQEKSREKSIAELEKRKKVSLCKTPVLWVVSVMTTTKYATRPLGQCCRLSYTIFRG